MSWDDDKSGQEFDAAISLIAEDRKGLFSDVSKVCLDMDIDISGLNAKKDKDGTCTMDLTLSLANTDDIVKVMSRMKQIKGVIDVFRTRS